MASFNHVFAQIVMYLALGFYIFAFGGFIVCCIAIFLQFIMSIFCGANFEQCRSGKCSCTDHQLAQATPQVAAVAEAYNRINSQASRVNNKLFRVVITLNGSTVYPDQTAQPDAQNVMINLNQREANRSMPSKDQLLIVLFLLVISLFTYIIWNNIVFCILVPNDLPLPENPFAGHTLYNVTSNYSFLEL